MSIPLPKEAVVVAGIKGPVAPRLEIRDLVKNKAMWYLFLKGLQSFQREDAKSPRSYYAISGIHGRPYTPYNDVVGRKLSREEIGDVGGYCAHTSIVFATWHRPFLALFEQELWRHVQKEAAKLNDPTGAIKKAAQAVRLPYWDWALPKSMQSEFWPQVFEAPTLTVEGFGTVDPNPLATFSLKGLSIRPGETWAFNGERTSRLPGLGTKLGQAIAARNTSVSKLMFTEVDWLTFSNNGYRRAQNPSQFASIEEVHDKIHIELGRTMGSVDTSAFDPVFWLHHCNIDRLTAVRQAIWPQYYISEKGQKVGGNGTNFVAQTGDFQNNKTPLKPFWRVAPTAADAVSTAKYDAVFWNSQQVETTEIFGYTYPETFDRATVKDAAKFSVIVKARADVLYPADLTPRFMGFARMAAPHDAIVAQEPLKVTEMLKVEAIPVEETAEATTAEAPAEAAPEAAPEVPSAPIVAPLEATTSEIAVDSGTQTRDSKDLIEPDNTYTDWSVNIRATKHVLGKPYQVIVFDGPFNPDPARWTSEYNKVDTVAVLGQGGDTACAKCREDQAHDTAVAGVVSLTSALIQDYMEGELASLKPEHVVPFLRTNLHWRVLVDGETDVPREEVPGLVVCVSSTTVSFDENGIPVYSTETTLHPEITDGRPAGLNVGGEP
ncbi:hypothetical protein B0T16DRAFT_403180 [Cercophora newfieldiana]|uniref:tyrosinase n=1 Tax=Cercophora newfieldiana TaxID=92897 RepID=A0AA39YEC9_9PEZI|nr:hypothetical protein B0T16DRAFT_403180 [Cercophora newfieldiana]